jgi:hypothetical protein
VHPDIEKAKALLYGAIRDLTPDEAETPVEGKWSIAGIVEHLSLAYSRSATGLRRLMSTSSEIVPRSRTLKQRVQQFVVVTLGYLPTGRESPTAVVPKGRPYPEVVGRLDQVFAELDKTIAEASQVLGGSRAVVEHPILGPFSVNQWRKFHVVHTRHHARQIIDRRQQAEGRRQK